MRHATKLAALAVAAVLAGSTAWAETPWLHVRVEEADSQEKVAVNLPLSVVEVVLKAAPDKIVDDGHIKLGHHHHGLSVSDLRQAWAELAAVGDADIVTVEKEDETVHIGRRGDQLQVRVMEKDGEEEVQVDVPAAVVDALLSGEGDELNIAAAISELSSIRGDIVRVRDKDDTVRIWIDDNAGS
jgi:hypothetical protein